MSAVHVERTGPLATLHMRHGPANALDLELLGALIEAVDAVERDGAEAVVLTGAGSCFSAGVDLKRVVAGGAPYVRELLPLLRAAFTRLAFFERPVVAAVNGHAIAGGIVLLSAADQAIAARGTAHIGATEHRVGVPFPAIALELIRLRAGTAQAAYLAYGAMTVGPEEALARGVVDEVVEPAALRDRAAQVATELAAAGPAFRIAKRRLRQPMRDAVAAAADEALVDLVWESDATLAAVSRFVAATLG